MITTIYTISNKLNGKQYIGISSNLQSRWQNHKNSNGLCPALHNAIKKYGKDSFEFVHIADAFNWQNACSIEKSLIQDLNTKAPNGYNLTYGGDGTLGFRHTNEECKRRSERCPTRNPKVMKLIADKQRGVKRPQTSGANNAMYGRLGKNSHMLKYTIIATNHLTGNKITLTGAKQINDAGFNRAHVYECAKNIRKLHKNHTFEFKGAVL